MLVFTFLLPGHMHFKMSRSYPLGVPMISSAHETMRHDTAQMPLLIGGQAPMRLVTYAGYCGQKTLLSGWRKGCQMNIAYHSLSCVHRARFFICCFYPSWYVHLSRIGCLTLCPICSTMISYYGAVLSYAVYHGCFRTFTASSSCSI